MSRAFSKRLIAATLAASLLVTSAMADGITMRSPGFSPGGAGGVSNTQGTANGGNAGSRS
jgi:hypothetical protein